MDSDSPLRCIIISMTLSSEIIRAMNRRMAEYDARMDRYIGGIVTNGQRTDQPDWRRQKRRYQMLKSRVKADYRDAVLRHPELVETYTLRQKHGTPVCTYCGDRGHSSRGCGVRTQDRAQARLDYMGVNDSQ